MHDNDSNITRVSRPTPELDAIRAARRWLGGSNELPAPPTAAPRQTPAIAGYEFIREVHRGGQGVVYEALQRSTGRSVAIKFLRHGAISTDAERSRLLREVRILGQLKHPAIVTMHDSGECEGLPYFVMDYIDGRPLDRFVDEEQIPQRQRVAMIQRIAEAVQQCHLRGVIHRDLKPANILVDADGAPHVVDFGLAKVDDDSGQHSLMTQTGQIVGSVPWLSPEQARGDHAAVDVRTDVYALGVISWQVLIGAFPYDLSSDMPAALRTIVEAEPSLDRRTASQVSRDLETILRRCLAKEPERRYQNAGELAADLAAYLDGRPILARRDNQWYLARKLISRNRTVSALLAAVFVLAVGASFGLSVLYARAEASRIAERRSAYRANLGAAAAGLLPFAPGQAQYNLALTPPDLRGWEWQFLSRLADESTLTISPDDGPPCGVVWSRDGTQLITGSFDKQITIWDAGTGALIDTMTGHTDILFDLALSPGGLTLASCGRDRTVRIWDLPTRTERHVLQAPERVTDVAFSPDGNRVAGAASYSGVVVVWDATTGEELLRLPPHLPLVRPVAFSANGTLLATGSVEFAGGQGAASIRLHDAQTGELVREIQTESWGVMELAFIDDDSALCATTKTHGLQIFDLRNPDATPLHAQLPDTATHCLAVAPNEEAILTGGKDGVLRAFDSLTGQPLLALRGHLAGINRLSVAPRGDRAATTSADGTVRVWDLTQPGARRVLRDHAHGVDTVVFSPGGDILASGSRDTTIRIWDTQTWSVLHTLNDHPVSVWTIAFSRDGSLMASGCLANQESGASVYLWDRSWQPTLVADGLNHVNAVAIDPRGERVVAVIRGEGLRVWDVDSLEELAPFAVDGKFSSVRYSPDGSDLIVYDLAGHLLVLDSATHDERLRLPVPGFAPDKSMKAMTYSTDGSLFAAATGEQLTVWRTGDWRIVTSLATPGQSPITSLVFSPDDTRLFAGTTIGVSIIDTDDWSELLRLRDAVDVYKVAICPDGTDLVACSSEATIHVWSID